MSALLVGMGRVLILLPAAGHARIRTARTAPTTIPGVSHAGMVLGWILAYNVPTAPVIAGNATRALGSAHNARPSSGWLTKVS